MRDFSELPLIDLAFLHARCSEVDGCLLWKGQMRHGPAVMIKRKTYKVRHLVWKAMGHRLDKSSTLVSECGDERCLACLKKEVRNSHARGKPMTLLHRKHIAEAKRKAMGTITIEVAREIRESDDILVVLAKRYNISLSNAHRVKQNKSWIDYTNPFAALGAR